VRRLSDFLGRDVVTEEGEILGRCFDLRAERSASSLEITHVVFGKRGFLERLGIGSSRGEAKRHHKVWAHDSIPWDEVVRLESGQIVVGDRTEPR
jgi:sporulation protein YlmC with PRC-barrel domain